MGAEQVKRGRLEGLYWLRDELVDQIDADACCTCEKPSMSQMAPLAGRLVTVLEQIEALEAASKVRGSKVDDLANRRKDRRSGSKSAGGPSGDRVDGGAGRG